MNSFGYALLSAAMVMGLVGMVMLMTTLNAWWAILPAAACLVAAVGGYLSKMSERPN